jgi:hypothetical protein
VADTSDGTMAFITEATYGVTPASPAFKGLRFTSETLSQNVDTLISNEIRPDATVADVRRSTVQTGGEIQFELASDTNFQDLMAAALRGTWTTNVLKGGVLKPSFTFERKITGAATTTYMRFLGSRIESFSLNVSPEQLVTGSMGIVGASHTTGTAILSGATYTGAGSNPVMAGADITAIALSGVAGVDYLSATLNVTNNLRVQRKLGTTAARGVGYGRRQITGEIMAYFEDTAAYTTFLSDSVPSLTFTVTNGANSYAVSMPKIRITSGEVPNDGNDNDFIVKLGYQAIFDSGISSDIQITRV